MNAYGRRPSLTGKVLLLVVLVVGAAVTLGTFSGVVKDVFVAIGRRIGGA